MRNIQEDIKDYKKKHGRFPVADEMKYAYMDGTEIVAVFEPSKEDIDLVREEIEKAKAREGS